VVCLEPDPENFALLSRSVSDNPRRQIRAFNLALSDHDGVEKLNLSDEFASYHSIARRVGAESIDVPAATFDHLAGQLGIQRVDLMKIDVEGGEPKVLTGCRTSLRSGKIRALTIEWWSETWREYSSLWAELIGHFDVYQIVFSPRLIQLLPDPSLEALCRRFPVEGHQGTDLFLYWKGGPPPSPRGPSEVVR
jgi:FkbM family methyltransferase